MAVTLKDIANEVEMSSTAVSQVLNNRPCRISEEKKELIRRTAAKLNYYPNQTAVALATKKTNNIGVVVFDIANIYFANMARGIDDIASENGYQIVLVNMSTRDNKPKDFSKYTGLNGTDAIIITSSINEPGIQEYLAEYTKQKRPIVCTGPLDGLEESNLQDKVAVVKFNEEKGAYLAVSHLIAKGHRKIGCITGPNITPSGRVQGYKRALEEAGIEYNEDLVEGGDFHQEVSCRKALELYKKGATAIFAFNDLMAYGVYQMAKQNGLEIGKDISIVGFDDLDYSSLLSVPLTTIRQPAYEIGVAGATMAIDLLKKQKLKAEPVYFEPELIIRNSVAEK